jgi:hypothetical protein
MATREDLKNAIREVLNEGTAKGQKTWAGTSEATLGTLQMIANILRGDVISAKLPVSSSELKAILDAQNSQLQAMRQELDALKAKIGSLP